MKVNTEEILNEIIDKMQDITRIRANDIPNIDLYMDQVTTFMDEKLRGSLRQGEKEEKVLTKTMINNYAKNDLLPPPVKKKYSREHMMVLIFIYYFKSFLTINDIETLLNPLTENYFNGGQDRTITDIYEEVLGRTDEGMDLLANDMRNKLDAAQKTFADAPEEDRDYLQLFSYICFLSYDIFVKKMLVERLLDEVSEKRKAQEEETKRALEEQQKKEKEDLKREKEESKRDKKSKGTDK